MKVPKTAIVMADGPWGTQYRESKAGLSPVNQIIFKCKFCGMVTYAKDPNCHKQNCEHPFANIEEK